jgi:uncharacterized RmlC-like cupin family protein
MSQARPVVIHPEEAMLGPATPGMEQRLFFDPAGRWAGWAGWIRNEAGEVSPWHHHPVSDTYVYVIRGSLTIHFGPGGAESVVARAGDFFFIPSHTIHRETTSSDTDLEAFVLRFGREPEHVNVDGPEPAGE